MANQDEGEGRRWVHWSGRLFPCVRPVLEKACGGKDVFSRKKETSEGLDRIVVLAVEAGENSRLTGLRRRKSVGR